jgi:hypothetical protein
MYCEILNIHGRKYIEIVAENSGARKWKCAIVWFCYKYVKSYITQRQTGLS